MYQRLCLLGLVVLAGCGGTSSEPPKATTSTDRAATSVPDVQPAYTITVPHMT
jgi:hypothetical protein